MFKNCRNHPKKYFLCQKPAKSGSTRIRKYVLPLPSGGFLCNQGHNGFQNCGKLLINKKPIFNLTAYSNVELNILGRAIWLTTFLNHL